VVAPTSGYNPSWPAGLTPPAGPEGLAGDADPAPLMEFVPLRRLSPGESTPPRFANTGYVPSPGFLTLSTAYSSPGRPALFQTGGVHGVRSSGVFPRGQVPQLVIAELPSWRFFLRNANVMLAVRRRAPWRFRGATRTFGRLQGVAPTENPYRWRIIHPEPNGRSPPELFSASPGGLP